jgi:predicted component of type VI protein secretion system
MASSKDDLRFTKVEEQDSNEAFADIQKNRSLLVAKLTDNPASKPELAYDLKTMDDVFEHYKPNVNVGFEDAEGKQVEEKMEFSKMDQFGRKGLVAQSPFLQELSTKKDAYQGFTQKLKSNKTLQSMLSNPEAKAAYLTALRGMIAELEQSE